MNISILVSAFESQDFLEECLDSIDSQEFDGDFEVLLGIDGCRKTLDKFNEIKSKYSRVVGYFFPKNSGTYVTCNSIYEFSKHEVILRFDSDDIMNPGMLRAISAEMLPEHGHCRFHHFDIFDESTGEVWQNDRGNQAVSPSHGQIAIRRSLLEQLGGWKPWPCSADTDLIERADRSPSGKALVIYGKLFRKRKHPKSLMHSKKTGFGSATRNHFEQQMSKKFQSIERVTAKCEEIPTDFKFTSHWNQGARPTWKKNLSHLAGKDSVSALEIGTYEGRSAKWWLENILTGKWSKLICVESNPDYLRANLRAFRSSGLNPLIPIFGKFKDVALSGQLEGESFDFIYLDAGKEGSVILESAILAWPYLKTGGILIFDDYEWQWNKAVSILPNPPMTMPKVGIDAFLSGYRGLYRELTRGFQITIRKL